MKKTNSDTSPAALYSALLDATRESQSRDYGSVNTSQHALERVMRRIAKRRAKSGETMGIYPLPEWAKEERSQRDYQITKQIRVTRGVLEPPCYGSV